MLRPLAGFVTLCLLGGCASSPPPAREPLVISGTQEAPEAGSPAAPRGQAPCTVSEQSINDSVALRFEPRGDVQATLVDAAASLELKESSPRLQLEADGVVLWTPYDPEEHPLHLRRPIALSQVLTPAAHAIIEWRGQAPGNAAQLVSYQATDALHSARFEGEVACSDLGLNRAAYDLPLDPDGEPKTLVGEVPVSVAPGGPRVVTLPPGTEPIACRELGREGGFVKIEADDSGDARLVGWVPGRFVHDEPGASGFGLSGMGGGGRAYGRAPINVEFTRCAEEVRLMLSDAAGVPREVGLIRKDTPFQVLDERPSDPRHVLVDLWVGWIWPKHGQPAVHFLIDKSSLAACAAAEKN